MNIFSVLVPQPQVVCIVCGLLTVFYVFWLVLYRKVKNTNLRIQEVEAELEFEEEDDGKPQSDPLERPQQQPGLLPEANNVSTAEEEQPRHQQLGDLFSDPLLDATSTGVKPRQTIRRLRSATARRHKELADECGRLFDALGKDKETETEVVAIVAALKCLFVTLEREFESDMPAQTMAMSRCCNVVLAKNGLERLQASQTHEGAASSAQWIIGSCVLER
eukprot:GHVU01121926.1.p2 GENE.GHVU01121926.1~~GHVU01121926.1.p2  ORF type:complete len:220 (-),score=39.68 GHVU01121926.1:256-915(-)